MTEKRGIFARLRRRRWALGLAFGYALLLNALLGTSVQAAMAATEGNPGRIVAAAPLCGAADPAPSGSRHGPTDHPQTCPLCGPACPMAAGAPLQTGPGPIAVMPPQAVPTGIAWSGRRVIAGPGLYASDIDSQGPPAA